MNRHFLRGGWNDGCLVVSFGKPSKRARLQVIDFVTLRKPATRLKHNEQSFFNKLSGKCRRTTGSRS